MNRTSRRPEAPRAKSKPTPASRGLQRADAPRLRTITIGTAGHVDHGKSALVRALTGVDPDRLQEEQDRGMTIVLGFAPLTLPSGRLLNIVDVPGHEQFVRTMASGVCGMEAVLLCIDSRERVMPQTREHLDILGLLGIRRGVVVITKADLLEDPAERTAAAAAIRAELRGTILQDAMIVWTSSRTSEGLGALVDVLDALVVNLPTRDEAAPVRMPIDRTFTVKGFGCVVTGPLLQGTLRVDQQLTLLPAGTPVRVRGIQIQHEDAADARAGERPAINLAGVDAADVAAGNLLADPRAFAPTNLVLAEFTLLPRARAISRRTELEFLIGTAVASGRARIHTAGRQLAPGETASGGLLSRTPLVCVHNDLILVRDVATNTTIGCARVLDPHPESDTAPESITSLPATAPVGAAAAALVEATGAAGMPEATLAHKIGALSQTLPSLVHTSKTYWLQDEIARAREVLIDTMPGPGRSVALTDWWASSSIQDGKILDRLTTQIVHSFQLRQHDGRVFCPRRSGPVLTTALAPAAAPARPVRLTPLALARTEAVLRKITIVTLTAPPSVGSFSVRHITAAIPALCASGHLVQLTPRYFIHTEVLARVAREITLPTTDHCIAQLLGISGSQAHALLGYLVTRHTPSRTYPRSRPLVSNR